MARPRLTESARVSIALKVSQVDAARIDEVLTRPEFAGWTRAEWCREIIRTALRYYVGDAPAPDSGRARVPAQPAAAQPAAAQPAGAQPAAVQPVPPAPTAAGAPPGPAVGPPTRAAESGAGAAGAAAPMPSAAGEARPGGREAPERPAESECPHPAEARDWQTGTCAACGAILWD
ncbi:MAG: hypothetical protein ACTHPS_00800 [Streptosporangiaceae bacterium]